MYLKPERFYSGCFLNTFGPECFPGKFNVSTSNNMCICMKYTNRIQNQVMTDCAKAPPSFSSIYNLVFSLHVIVKRTICHMYIYFIPSEVGTEKIF